MNRTSAQIETAVVHQYISGSTLDEVAAIHGLGRTTVCSILKRQGIKTRTVSEVQRNQRVNHACFSINGAKSYYWAGFLAADGCLYMLNGRSFLVAVSSADVEHMMKLATWLGDGNLIRRYSHPTAYGTTNGARVAFASKQVFGDLCGRFSLCPNKSHVLVPPQLEVVDLIHHFVRGYFDGDGHILTGVTRGVGFSGTHAMLSWIKSILCEQCGAGDPQIVADKSIFSLRFGGRKQSSRIIEWLYRDSDESMRLERKWRAAQSYTHTLAG